MLGFSSISAACHIARYLGIARDGDKNAGTQGSLARSLGTLTCPTMSFDAS